MSAILDGLLDAEEDSYLLALSLHSPSHAAPTQQALLRPCSPPSPPPSALTLHTPPLPLPWAPTLTATLRRHLNLHLLPASPPLPHTRLSLLQASFPPSPSTVATFYPALSPSSTAHNTATLLTLHSTAPPLALSRASTLAKLSYATSLLHALRRPPAPCLSHPPPISCLRGPATPQQLSLLASTPGYPASGSLSALSNSGTALLHPAPTFPPRSLPRTRRRRPPWNTPDYCPDESLWTGFGRRCPTMCPGRMREVQQRADAAAHSHMHSHAHSHMHSHAHSHMHSHAHSHTHSHAHSHAHPHVCRHAHPYACRHAHPHAHRAHAPGMTLHQAEMVRRLEELRARLVSRAVTLETAGGSLSRMCAFYIVQRVPQRGEVEQVLQRRFSDKYRALVLQARYRIEKIEAGVAECFETSEGEGAWVAREEVW